MRAAWVSLFLCLAMFVSPLPGMFLWVPAVLSYIACEKLSGVGFLGPSTLLAAVWWLLYRDLGRSRTDDRETRQRLCGDVMDGCSSDA